MVQNLALEIVNNKHQYGTWNIPMEVQIFFTIDQITDWDLLTYFGRQVSLRLGNVQTWKVKGILTQWEE